MAQVYIPLRLDSVPELQLAARIDRLEVAVETVDEGYAGGYGQLFDVLVRDVVYLLDKRAYGIGMGDYEAAVAIPQAGDDDGVEEGHDALGRVLQAFGPRALELLWAELVVTPIISVPMGVVVVHARRGRGVRFAHLHDELLVDPQLLVGGVFVISLQSSIVPAQSDRGYEKKTVHKI